MARSCFTTTLRVLLPVLLCLLSGTMQASNELYYSSDIDDAVDGHGTDGAVPREPRPDFPDGPACLVDICQGEPHGYVAALPEPAGAEYQRDLGTVAGTDERPPIHPEETIVIGRPSALGIKLCISPDRYPEYPVGGLIDLPHHQPSRER